MPAFGVAVVTALLSCVFMWVAAPRKGAVLRQKAMEAEDASLRSQCLHSCMEAFRISPRPAQALCDHPLRGAR